MSRSASLRVLTPLALALAATLISTACGGGNTPIVVAPPPTYSLTGSALTPVSIGPGGTATSTITLSPSNGYTGSITLSCVSVSGGTPPPTCAFNPPTASITGTSAVSSTLTVTAASNTPLASYTVNVTGKDGSGNPPANGAQQQLALTVGAPSYSLAAATLNPSSVAAGSAPNSTLTITPVNGYTGTVNLTCAVTGNSTPAPTCAIAPTQVTVTSTVSAAPVLTVTTTTSNPSAAYSISVTGKDGGGTAPSNGVQSLALTIKFQHVVIIVQENRTPDNLFQDAKLVTAGADIIDPTQAKGSTGTIAMQSTSLGIDYDISHENQAWVTMCHPSGGTCLMDQADLIAPITCEKGVLNCDPTSPPAEFYYVQQIDVQPYWDIAEQYTFADRMFQTNQGPSFPAHQFLIAGTSEPSDGSNLFVGENPLGPTNSSADAGCIAPSNEYVSVIDPFGSETSNPTIYPCIDHPSLTDELEAATPAVTWRYYAPLSGSIWTAPTAIEHICVPNNAPPNGTACTGTDYLNNVSLAPGGQGNPPILTDLANNDLRQVTWVIPTGQNSDHAGDPTTTGGPSWVASVVNAIGGNPQFWPNTAIIIVWDDWGGWYDHVPPPKIINDGTSWGSGYVYGFRVPLIVVSPVAKAGYISHTVHDFGSILNLIEQNFGVGQLGFADSNTTDNLADCFNYSQAPITFTTINAPLKADYFIHDKRPPLPPDTD